MTHRVDRLLPADWRRAKAIRLRALADDGALAADVAIIKS